MASSSRNPGKRPMAGGDGGGGGDDGGECPLCGRRFHSRRALFGHMRTHPDRGWRGIVPPSPSDDDDPETQEAADSLLLLAESQPVPISSLPPVHGPFVCAWCSGVFESFEALGEHHASLRAVGGCFAAAREVASAGLRFPELGPRSGPSDYQCTVCQKAFPTGQALGGHMRWHLDREPVAPVPPPPPSVALGMERLWGSAGLRWLHDRNRRQGAVISQAPAPVPPPPGFRPLGPQLSFHMGWGGPRQRYSPHYPSPALRGYGPGPWYASSSSAGGYTGRPQMFPGGPSYYSSQIRGLAARGVAGSSAAAAAGGRGGGGDPPPLPPPSPASTSIGAGPRSDDEDDDDGNINNNNNNNNNNSIDEEEDSAVDLNLRLGR